MPHDAQPAAAETGDSTASFAHDGGPTGVLLCHGFTGSPHSLRPWADRLAAEGFTVRLPRLPGHGTRWQDMNRTTFADWLAADLAALAELTQRCRTVVVGGLSMGGTLALRMAELRPADVHGLVLVNPSVLSRRRELAIVPLLKHVVPAIKGIGSDIADPAADERAYDRTPLRALDSLRRAWPVVRAGLPQVTAPTLLLHSRVDHVVEPENAAAILTEIGSTDVTEIVLERSYHVATLDYDAALIQDESIAFINRIAAGRAAGGAQSVAAPGGAQSVAAPDGGTRPEAG